MAENILAQGLMKMNKLVDEARYAKFRRIERTFGRICVNPPSELPLVYLSDYHNTDNQDEYHRTGDEFTRIPLVGGGHIDMGRVKDKTSRPDNAGALVMQITASNTRGEMVEFPVFETPYHWSNTLNFISGKNDAATERQIKLFLANLDLERDIDLSGAASFSDAQRAVVIALGATLPPKSAKVTIHIGLQ